MQLQLLPTYSFPAGTGVRESDKVRGILNLLMNDVTEWCMQIILYSTVGTWNFRGLTFVLKIDLCKSEILQAY